MKKFINFLSLALIAMLSFASCSSDNNEPSNSTPANYLVGKIFQSGDDPKTGDKKWDIQRFSFTNSNKGVFHSEVVRKNDTGGVPIEDFSDVEFTYTYVKPTLTVTMTKVISATMLKDGVIQEDPEVQERVGEQFTFTVNETLNTITHTDSEDTTIFTLKK